MMVYTFLTTQPKGDEVSSYIGARSSYPLRDVILLLKKAFLCKECIYLNGGQNIVWRPLEGRIFNRYG